jgi:hypothetical protein
MPIEVEWQDEAGQCVARYGGPDIGAWLIQHAPANGCCMRFIDVYGDTTFNAAQVEVLEAELRSLGTVTGVAKQAGALLAFIQSCENRLHRYLKFIGD